MSDNFLLNWAALAFSIFDVILLLWLGLTVLLNSDRRTWGIWLTSVSLFLAALFFIAHAVIVYLGIDYTNWESTLWWRLGVIPAVMLPYAWYVVMLWYTGYWTAPDSPLRRRQRFPLLGLSAALAIGVLTLIILNILVWPLSPETRSAGMRTLYPSLGLLMPVAGGGFIIYMLGCFLFSLDALRRPGPSFRAMGEFARQRARPWLIGTTFTLLGVAVLVSGIIGWVVYQTLTVRFYLFYVSTIRLLAEIDFLVLLLVTTAIILMGQAAVSYEVFTGKTLPRDGFQRHWRMVLLIGLGFSLLISTSLQFDFPLISSVLLMTVLFTGIAALFNRQTYIDRERTIASLKPFITSQRTYESLLAQRAAGGSGIDSQQEFAALCQNVLEVETGFLTAVGPLSSLVTSTLRYPRTASPPRIQPLLNHFHHPDVPSQPLDPTPYAGAQWAVPLWSARELIGLLLLGPKRDGGLFTEEVIEIARAGGERLLDTQASAEIARRLITLQRQKMAETQLLDQRTRRVLHDEVLPLLHTSLLALSANGSQTQEAVSLLGDAHKQISDLLHQMPTAISPIDKVGLFGALKRVIQHELPAAFNEVHWEIAPEAQQKAATLPHMTAEVMFYAAREALRNAAKYARGGGEAPLNVVINGRWDHGLLLTIEDNGIGFRDSLDGTSPPSGENGGGHGLALHTTMLAVVGGQLVVNSQPGEYTRVSLKVPAEG